MAHLVIRREQIGKRDKFFFTPVPAEKFGKRGSALESIARGELPEAQEAPRRFPTDKYLQDVLSQVNNPERIGTYFFLVDSLIGIGRPNSTPTQVLADLERQLGDFEARRESGEEVTRPGETVPKHGEKTPEPDELAVLRGYGRIGSDIPSEELEVLRMPFLKRRLGAAAGELRHSNTGIGYKVFFYNYNRRGAYRADAIDKSLLNLEERIRAKMADEPVRERTVDPKSGVLHEVRGGGFWWNLARIGLGLSYALTALYRGFNGIILSSLDGLYPLHANGLKAALEKEKSSLNSATALFAGQLELYLDAYGALARERLLVPLMYMQYLTERLPAAAGKPELIALQQAFIHFHENQTIVDNRIPERIDDLVKRLGYLQEDIAHCADISEITRLINIEGRLHSSLIGYMDQAAYPTSIPELPPLSELGKAIRTTKATRSAERKEPRTRLYAPLSQLVKTGYVKVLDRVSRFNTDNDVDLLGWSGKCKWDRPKSALAGLHELTLLMAEGMASYETYVNMQDYAALAIRQRLDEIKREKSASGIGEAYRNSPESIVESTLLKLNAERRASYEYVRTLLPSLIPTLENYVHSINHYAKGVRLSGFPK